MILMYAVGDFFIPDGSTSQFISVPAFRIKNISFFQEVLLLLIDFKLYLFYLRQIQKAVLYVRHTKIRKINGLSFFKISSFSNTTRYI